MRHFLVDGVLAESAGRAARQLSHTPSSYSPRNPDQNGDAAYGGIFVAGSLAWGMLVDKFRPDRWDVIGAAVCLIGVALIMYAPHNPT